MERKRENKKCGACGGEAVYVQDADLVDRTPLMADITLSALYRCTLCGHFNLYEREEDREARERDAELRRQYQAMPDYRCPLCGRVSKNKLCDNCRMPGVTVTSAQPEQPEAPERAEPEKPKKHRWFGRDPDKPDWEG